MNNCLLTGMSGFLGPYVFEKLKTNCNVRALSLRNLNIRDYTISDVDVLVHLAGKAHVMGGDDVTQYFEVNRDMTLMLAERAKKDGVKHFVYISSIKVYGDHEVSNFNESSLAVPTDAYGQSKLEAEDGLREIETKDFVVSIVRPPLIYGKGVKGNLEKLINLSHKLPLLPFEGIDNKRNFVYAGNVAELINKLIIARKSGIFIANDGCTKSTSELVNEILVSLNRSKRIFPLPGIAKLMIKYFMPEFHKRIFGDYYFDFSNTNKSLNFAPPHTFEEGILEMVMSYKNNGVNL